MFAAADPDELTLVDVDFEETGWEKTVNFIYRSEMYTVFLEWAYDKGYKLTWKNPKERPDWVDALEDETHEDIEYLIDVITWDFDGEEPK